MGQQNITQKNIPKLEKPTQKSIQKIALKNSRSNIHKIFTWIEVKQNLTGK
jgi:hypothetical protein